ncbi:hypothetical protein R6Q59_023968 [Mikania micrantha]
MYSDHINDLGLIEVGCFLLVNSLAAEKLYAPARDSACLGPSTLLFGVYCGIRTIGLTLTNHVGMVVRIETNPSAVADANRNGEDCGLNENGSNGSCGRFSCVPIQSVCGLIVCSLISGNDIHLTFQASKPDMTNQWCLLLQRCKPASELLQCKITSYLEAILDVGSGLDDAKSSLLLREAGRLIPTLDSMKLISSVLGQRE